MKLFEFKKTCQSCQFFDKNQHPDYYCIDFKTKNEDVSILTNTHDDVSIVKLEKQLKIFSYPNLFPDIQ